MPTFHQLSHSACPPLSYLHPFDWFHHGWGTPLNHLRSAPPVSGLSAWYHELRAVTTSLKRGQRMAYAPALAAHCDASEGSLSALSRIGITHLARVSLKA